MRRGISDQKGLWLDITVKGNMEIMIIFWKLPTLISLKDKMVLPFIFDSCGIFCLEHFDGFLFN